MRRVPRTAVLGLVLVAVAGVGAGYLVSGGGTDARGRGPGNSASPAAARTPTLEQLSDTAPLPTASGVADALRRPSADAALGAALSGRVVDAVTGRVLYARNDGASLPPASTAKLLTAVAALEALGPQGSLDTSLRRDGDTLFLVGGGDVDFDPRAMAAAAVPALTGSKALHLRVDLSAWTGPGSAPGWRPGYFTDGDIAPVLPLSVDEGRLRPHRPPRSNDPAGDAGRALADQLRRDGVSVVGPVTRAATPATSASVAEQHSAPLAELVARMLTDSDNDLAESLGRAVAHHDRRPASFAGEAAAVRARLRALGVDVTRLTLYDASGLSRLDRVDAPLLTTILRVCAGNRHPELRAVLDGLPVAGLTGTLSARFRRTPASAGAGVVRAKTGTLAGVNTLAGVVVDADGRLLVFAFLTDQAASPSRTEAALDRLAAVLAGCGCRSPTT